MKNLGYYNGEIGLIENLTVPMIDRAFYFGDGVYDAVMCRNNIPYLLCEHVERFYFNCERLRINVQMSQNALYELIYELVKKVDANEKFVYFQASRGSALRAHSAMPKNANICIMITPLEVGSLLQKMRAVLVPDNRYELCDIKTLNLLPSVLAAQIAQNADADEAIFHRKGVITEGSHCNVFIIKNDKIITAPKSKYILPGVTRASLIKEAEQLGIVVQEREYRIDELMEADEVLITSSSKLLRGIETIDGERVGGKGKKMLEMLQSRLLNHYLNATNPSV